MKGSSKSEKKITKKVPFLYIYSNDFQGKLKIGSKKWKFFSKKQEKIQKISNSSFEFCSTKNDEKKLWSKVVEAFLWYSKYSTNFDELPFYSTKQSSISSSNVLPKRI